MYSASWPSAALRPDMPTEGGLREVLIGSLAYLHHVYKTYGGYAWNKVWSGPGLNCRLPMKRKFYHIVGHD
ncbi:MAG: hypothetical protein QW247_09395 [Pyrobaculum sp.]